MILQVLSLSSMKQLPPHQEWYVLSLLAWASWQNVQFGAMWLPPQSTVSKNEKSCAFKNTIRVLPPHIFDFSNKFFTVFTQIVVTSNCRGFIVGAYAPLIRSAICSLRKVFVAFADYSIVVTKAIFIFTKTCCLIIKISMWKYGYA